MTGPDLLTKFNRGLIISLVDKNVYEAIQTFRQYSSYLHSKAGEEYEQELLISREAFFNKLIQFVQNKENENKTYELIAAYQELIAAFSDKSGLYLDCSLLFNKTEQYDIELELLLKAKETSAGDKTDINKMIVDAYLNSGKYEEGTELQKEVLKKEPDNPDNYYTMSVLNLKMYDKTDNEEYIKTAILNMETAKKINPDNKLYLKSLTVLYMRINDTENLKKAWDDCLTHKSEFTYTDYMDYAAFLIKRGDFKNGFEYYRARFNHETKPVKYPVINKPLWEGNFDISGKTLLVQWEQGLGDIFLFSRFFYELKEKANGIVARMPDSVLQILKRSFPFVEFVSMKTDLDKINFDCHIPLMSIPLAIKLNKDNLGHKERYLAPDFDKVSDFKTRFFNNNKFKIGIAFRGSERGMKSRNIPLEELLPLTGIEGTEFYSLQFAESDESFKDTEIKNLASAIETFDDTAALICNMDLIITGDNSVMNLAGALGIKTFCIFNIVSEYRWFDLSGEDVKWYSTVKPYCLKKQNEWKPVISKIESDIKKLIKQ